MMGDPAHWKEASEFDAREPIDKALRAVELIDEGLVTPKVAAYASGEHIASTESGWQLYVVETYGEVVPLMDCRWPAPLAYALHAMRRSQAEGRAEQTAKYNPSNAAAILAG